MSKKKRLTTRKEPIQMRSLELRKTILEASTYILKREGPYAFNTNRIAEKAGVSIASLYQYYPNKESILYHLQEIEWSETWGFLSKILKDPKLKPNEKLNNVIWSFFESESAEVELRSALKQTRFLFKDSKEFKKNKEEAFKELFVFFSEFNKQASPDKMIFKTHFIIRLVTSFAEDATSSETDLENLKLQSDVIYSMVLSYLES
jgi:AcrR family transcriptional regulator